MTLLDTTPWKQLRALAWAGAAALLLLPALAMRLGADVHWDALDFAVAAALLGTTGVVFELLLRRLHSPVQLLACALAVGSALVLAWVMLAVGVIGDGRHPANALYAVVLAIGAIGGVLTRFKPQALRRVFWCMAAAQLLAVTVTFALGEIRAAVAASVFALAWAVAAWLLHPRRAHHPSGPG